MNKNITKALLLAWIISTLLILCIGALDYVDYFKDIYPLAGVANFIRTEKLTVFRYSLAPLLILINLYAYDLYSKIGITIVKKVTLSFIFCIVFILSLVCLNDTIFSFFSSLRYG